MLVSGSVIKKSLLVAASALDHELLFVDEMTQDVTDTKIRLSAAHPSLPLRVASIFFTVKSSNLFVKEFPCDFGSFLCRSRACLSIQVFQEL